jgi:D-glycero-D-manno-heptose 1,7-bisphosphate phosphatase
MGRRRRSFFGVLFGIAVIGAEELKTPSRWPTTCGPQANRRMHSSHRSTYPPLDGTVRAPRGLFVDRWGTLLVTPSAGFARTPAEVRFQPGALDALFRASQAGWQVFLLGNEDAVAHGQLAPEAWQAVEKKMLAELAAAGVPVLGNYACLEHPEGVPGHQNDSVYLLPNTGAFYHALHTHGTELAKSWVIGDSTLELVAGWRAGLRMAAVRTGLALSDKTFEVDPEVSASDLRAVVLELLQRCEALHH